MKTRQCKLCGAEIIGRAKNATLCSECKSTRKKKYYIPKLTEKKKQAINSKQCETCEFGIGRNSSLYHAGIRCNFQGIMGISKIVAYPEYQAPPNCSAYRKRKRKGKKNGKERERER